MKIRLALLLSLLWPVVSAWAAGATTVADYATEMSVNADVQEQFFAKYPDLKDEPEVVSAAARALVGEGVAVNDAPTAAAAVAARARLILSERTPREWQRKAMSLFPELAVAGSEFNTLFLRHHEELKQTSPQFMEEPSWPVLLARRCADELRVQAQQPPTTAQMSTGGPAPAAAVPTASTFRAGWWSSLLNLALLLALTVQPARWLLRRSRAFADRDTAVALWQQALPPAAWAYVAFALIALFRTFYANADQRFIDRFGITLLVSLLAGLFFAVPAYGIALAVLGWRRRRVAAMAANPGA